MNPDLEPGRLEVARQRDLEVGDQLDAAALHLELNGEMSDEDPYAKTYTNKKSSTRKLKKKQRVETKTKTKKRQRTGHGTLPIEGAGAAVRAQLAAAAEARAASTPVVRSDSLTSSRSPLAWFEMTNVRDRNPVHGGGRRAEGMAEAGSRRFLGKRGDLVVVSGGAVARGRGAVPRRRRSRAGVQGVGPRVAENFYRDLRRMGGVGEALGGRGTNVLLFAGGRGG